MFDRTSNQPHNLTTTSGQDLLYLTWPETTTQTADVTVGMTTQEFLHKHLITVFT